MENPPYAPFNFIKQLISSLREAINRKVEFHIQLQAINKNAHAFMHTWSANWWSNSYVYFGPVLLTNDHATLDNSP